MATIDCYKLNQLLDKAADSEFLASFSPDPKQALESEGLMEGLPSEFVEAITNLSSEELAHIGEAVKLLRGYDVVVRGGNLCWF